MSRKDSTGNTNAQWYAEHPAVFLVEIDGLSLEHIGAYAKLKSIYWTNGCQLPGNLDTLKRKLAGISETVLQEVLSEFFPDGRNSYLDNQMQETQVIYKKRTDAARARWSGKGESSPPNGKTAKPKQPQAEVSYDGPPPEAPPEEAEKWFKERGISPPWDNTPDF